jgi:hypothetical protein
MKCINGSDTEEEEEEEEVVVVVVDDGVNVDVDDFG